MQELQQQQCGSVSSSSGYATDPLWRRPLHLAWWWQLWGRVRPQPAPHRDPTAPVPLPVANCTVWTLSGRRVASFVIRKQPDSPPAAQSWRGRLAAARDWAAARAVWLVWPRWRLMKLLPLLRPELGWVATAALVAGAWCLCLCLYLPDPPAAFQKCLLFAALPIHTPQIAHHRQLQLQLQLQRSKTLNPNTHRAGIKAQFSEICFLAASLPPILAARNLRHGMQTLAYFSVGITVLLLWEAHQQVAAELLFTWPLLRWLYGCRLANVWLAGWHSARAWWVVRLEGGCGFVPFRSFVAASPSSSSGLLCPLF